MLMLTATKSVFIVLLITVSSCVLIAKNSLRQVDLIADADANDNSAIRINIVFVPFQEPAEMLPRTADE